jgi:hypothetical protein
MNILEKHFSKAGLELNRLARPINRTNDLIFQMDIQKQGKGEVFRLWPGGEDNVIQVLGVDPKLRQLVLMIHEPKRMFVTKDWRGRETTHVTPEGKRHILCGHDERSYFMAQLPKPVSTVQKAHEVLKNVPPTAEKVKRQGEWFFTPLKDLDDLKGLPVHWKAPLGPGRNLHTADQLVRGKKGQLYVRGKVRHPEHQTVEFRSWQQVHHNREVVRNSSLPWMD